MTRAALLLSCLFVAACTIGELPPTGGNPGTDAGNSGTDAGPNANGCVDRLAPPQLVAHLHGGVPGATNAGQRCVTAACHGTGGTGPLFQAAGTVYKPDGTTPSAGVYVRIKTGTTTVAMGVTDNAGNFNILTGVTFPSTTDATACPNVAPMATQLVQAGAVPGGDCNGCHVVGGATGKITIAD
mgnify:CR=1 FL=1